MTRTLQQQTDLVRVAIRGVTTEQAGQIAMMCLDAETAGENAAVWHQSARFFGHKCNCIPCRRAAS